MKAQNQNQKLLANPRLALARDAFAEKAKNSRAWNDLVQRSIAEFGDSHTSPISGIYADHFPEARKTELRNLALAASSDLAWKMRPKRIRFSTMRKLRLAVIARDGSGFYG